MCCIADLQLVCCRRWQLRDSTPTWRALNCGKQKKKGTQKWKNCYKSNFSNFAVFTFCQEFPGFSSPGSVFLWGWCVYLPLLPKPPSLRSLWTPTRHRSTSTPSSQVNHTRTHTHTHTHTHTVRAACRWRPTCRWLQFSVYMSECRMRLKLQKNIYLHESACVRLCIYTSVFIHVYLWFCVRVCVCVCVFQSWESLLCFSVI